MSGSSRVSAWFAISMAWCAGACAEDASSLRGRLREQGLEFQFGYLSETATNVQGGDRHLWRYADQWTFGSTLDLQKLVGLEQATFQITLTDRNGRNLSADANLGSLQIVQEIYGRGQTWRWTQFAFDQKYLDGMLDWKIGRLVGGEDFAAFSCEFLNLTFCGQAPGNTNLDYWYTWPVSQWATRLKANFKGFGYVQVGVYEANPRYRRVRNGLDLGEPGGATGALVPLEVGWQPILGDRYPGTYKFGVWYNTSRAPDVAHDTDHNGHGGAYVNFLQRLSAPSADSRRGITAFLNANFNDQDSATVDSQIATGLFYVGPFASRPVDQLGVAIARTHTNSRIRTAATTAEYLAEVFYAVHVADWLDVRPSLQFSHQWGDLVRNTDDVIVGLRLTVSL